MRGAFHGGWLIIIFSLISVRGEPSALDAVAALLIFDRNAVHLLASALLHISDFPIFDVTSDVDAFYFRVQLAIAAAGLLLHVIGDVHLVRSALIFGFRWAVTMIRFCCHGSLPPGFIEVCFGADFLRAA